jgi:hypothetical protein
MYEERKNIVNYRKTFLYDSSPPAILRLLEIIENHRQVLFARHIKKNIRCISS